MEHVIKERARERKRGREREKEKERGRGRGRGRSRERERERERKREREIERKKHVFVKGVAFLWLQDQLWTIVNPENKPIKVNWTVSWPSALEFSGKPVL
jgi:hypothetical protein